jgi:hypothetical protein
MIAYPFPATPTDFLLAAVRTPDDPQNPSGLSLEAFRRDFTINATSAFVAAQQAVLAFEKVPESGPRTFIHTGNILNTFTLVGLLTLGLGESASAHIIEPATKAYKDKCYKFVPPLLKTGNDSLT